jgi:MoxR-like ATPase
VESNRSYQLNERIQQESAFIEDIVTETRRVLVGQQDLVTRLLIVMLCRGHIIIEGVPGLAKTLAVSTLSATVRAQFQRVQFTPDLLPSDVIGTEIYNQHTGEFQTRLGPIFANIVLADEINRAPAKVQSALLEAMAERQVTIGDASHRLPDLFMVLATQNPIEQEGTYRLPEAQLDRFMLKVNVTYPTRYEEETIMDRMSRTSQPRAQAVVSPDVILRAQQLVDDIYVDRKIKQYILDIIFASREPQTYNMDELAPLIQMAASPRATLSLLKASKAHAFLQQRSYVTPNDVKAIANDVLRHRIGVTFEAEARDVTQEDIVNEILQRTQVP